MIKKTVILLLAVQALAASLVYSQPPEKGLLIHIKASNVKNNNDAFLSNLSNEQQTSIVAQQTKVNRRPLFIKDFAQSQAAISISSSRSIRFKPVEKPADYHIIIGYYIKNYEQDYPDFKVLDFNSEKRENRKDGFSYVFENRTLVLRGEPGYDCAITELLFYNRKLRTSEHSKIFAEMKSKYYIRTDDRYANNGTKIDNESLYGSSNMIKLSNDTLMTFATKKASKAGMNYYRLETVRSYDGGENWSVTAATMSQEKFYAKPYVSLFQLDVSNTFALVLARDKVEDLPPLEQAKDDPKYARGLYVYRSPDEGFDWNSPTKINCDVEIETVTALSRGAVAGEYVYVLLDREDNVPLLATTESYTSSVTGQNEWTAQPVDQLMDIPSAVTPKSGSFNIASNGDKLIISFSSEKGHLLYAEIAEKPTLENKADAEVCRYPDNNYALMQGSVKTYYENTENMGEMFLSQVEKAGKGAYVYLLTKAREEEGWNQPELLLYSPNSEKDTFSFGGILEQDGDPMMYYRSGDAMRVQFAKEGVVSFIPRSMSLRTSKHLAIEIGEGKMHKYKTRTVNDFGRTKSANQNGLTLEFYAEMQKENAPEEILVLESSEGREFSVSRSSDNIIEYKVSGESGSSSLRFNCPFLKEEAANHIALIIDYRAEYVYGIINGQIVLPQNTDYNIYKLIFRTEKISLAEDFEGKLETVRVYDAPLKTADVLRNPMF
ncbi:hypothetical protein [Sedimentisphaera salicampi]|uniref:FHA domain-containing protein n=1 Tax=Sedimentisphaera salicampi TaxID=1941349 RepID=A0A1W6LN85_9BACT|nr:hypothetical protein [Sedimentisphaera salicampi]ARN57260.1 hypothetical protein STSP1_01663 [Sedimentisphaera salicampi]